MNQSDKLIFIRDLAEKYLQLLEDEDMNPTEIKEVFEIAMSDFILVVNGKWEA